MKNWTWKTWLGAGIVVALIVRNPAGSGEFVSQVWHSLAVFIDKV